MHLSAGGFASAGTSSNQMGGSDAEFSDGPGSPLFSPLSITGNRRFSDLPDTGISETMAEAAEHAPSGRGTAWGIPFFIPGKIVHLKSEQFSMELPAFKANYLVFLHTSDHMELRRTEDGFYRPPFKGVGQLSEQVADYIVRYDDGTEERLPIRQRHHLGMFRQIWGENCLQAVTDHKPMPVRPHHEQMAESWGNSQRRANVTDRRAWINWLWAWENPYPEKQITGFRFEPAGNADLVVSAITAGRVRSNPLRWQTRSKALLTLPANVEFDPHLDEDGLLKHLQLDLGQVISATPQQVYPDNTWAKTYNNQVPEISERKILIEYTAHQEAHFHLPDNNRISVSSLSNKIHRKELRPLPPATRQVTLRVVEKDTSRPVAVKLHVHGESGEYLAPVNRHRIPNNAWFEDYSVDYVNNGTHTCTYIPGETVLKLPEGKVYIEVSRGFEIKPIRKVVNVTPDTDEINITIEKVLPWREQGWVSADTHVHFLSPHSALLEGAGEGVNIVNLLASQWGELMTNVGDFDGRTTLRSGESGEESEHMVRVGTENRQHVLGHISLLGYQGNMITPLTTGGPDESALGDPIEILLTEWAEQCRRQGGLAILPHFPNPRVENAAAIINGKIDGVEMTSWGNLYGGIDPYSLTDWYRYLNNGYFVAAVGGTDKMSAGTAVGAVRTYARIDQDQAFTYDAWKQAVRKGHTFVTYGPLLDFTVDGEPMGERIQMSPSGGTVDVTWEAASVTVPMSRIELVVNGEIRESLAVSGQHADGHWSVKLEKSSWLALLVRGHYPDKPEIITAHSSPVMVDVEGSEMYAAADAVTILDQIEGALAYLDTIGTRAEDAAYKRMRMLLQSTHRSLHNRMHQMGYYHEHSPGADHPEHHGG